MSYTIRLLVSLVLFLTISLSASAAMYKCTDTKGNVSFSDKACPTDRQEVLKKRTPSNQPDGGSVESKPEREGSGFPKFEPIKPLAGGKKVTSSSPLAKAYMGFLNAVKRCDSNEMMNHVSSKMAQEMKLSKGKEFKAGCRALEMFLPEDFTDATEVIEGDKGKIQWLSIETTTDSSGTQTMKSEQTAEFVKENGVWKYRD